MSTGVSSYQRAREALGNRLRELRLDADLNGRQLAQIADWPPSKVSKIEAGRQTPSDKDIRAWALACRAEELIAELTASVRSLDQQYVEFRRMFRSGLPSRQRKIGDIEARAESIRNFEPCFVPGLLQTREYARYRFLEGDDGDANRGAPRSDAEVDEAVAARIERQQQLGRPGYRFHFVITEAVINYLVCPTEVMTGQLGHLVALTTLPTIRLGIIPFSAHLNTGPLHGFYIYGQDLVLVELFTASLHITQADEIGAYERVFAQLANSAAYGKEARAILTRTLTGTTATVM